MQKLLKSQDSLPVAHCLFPLPLSSRVSLLLHTATTTLFTTYNRLSYYLPRLYSNETMTTPTPTYHCSCPHLLAFLYAKQQWPTLSAFLLLPRTTYSTLYPIPRRPLRHRRRPPRPPGAEQATRSGSLRPSLPSASTSSSLLGPLGTALAIPLQAASCVTLPEMP